MYSVHILLWKYDCDKYADQALIINVMSVLFQHARNLLSEQMRTVYTTKDIATYRSRLQTEN